HFGKPFADHAASQAYQVHVVVFDALACGKWIRDQRRPNSFDLVGGDGSANTTAAYGNTAAHFTRRNSLGKGDDKIRIVVLIVQTVSPKVLHIVVLRLK